jgi:hypothetical protein
MMFIAVKLSDGQGGDLASGFKADIAVVELTTLDCMRLAQLMRECTKDGVVRSLLRAWSFQLDEVRINWPFRVFRDDGDYTALVGEWAEGWTLAGCEIDKVPQRRLIERWDDEGAVRLPDDWSVAEKFAAESEGWVECCVVAVSAQGLQLHCLPKHGEVWLRSYPFRLDEVLNAEKEE